MSAARTQYHRAGQSSLPIEPVVRLFAQLRDAIPGKELRRDPCGGGLIGHRLGAILAELKRMAVAVRVRPCATGTIEAGLLVNRQPRTSHPHRTHLGQAVGKRMNYRRDPRCYFGDGGYLQTLDRFGYLIRYDAVTRAWHH